MYMYHEFWYKFSKKLRKVFFLLLTRLRDLQAKSAAFLTVSCQKKWYAFITYYKKNTVLMCKHIYLLNDAIKIIYLKTEIKT